MKIIIVTQYFWPENFRISDLAVGLKAQGHEVTVLTGMPNYPEGRFFSGYSALGPLREEYHGVNIIRVPMISRGNSRGGRLALNYISFAVSASLLGPLLCREEYDLIFVSQYSPVLVGLPAIVLKRMKRIPLLMWVQDLWPESLSATGAVKSPTILGYVDKVVSFIYRQCDKILVQSKGFIKSVEEHGISADRIMYWPNWAESLYQMQERAPEAGPLDQIPDGFKVMFAGNIGEAQDFPTILKAAEKLMPYAEIQLIVVGDGRMKAWAEEEVARRGLTNVYFLGRYPIEAMPAFFARADAMLVTLKREAIFALTIPGKVQSYMACGKPIIACLEGEGARVIRDALAGMVCQPENADELAAAVLEMYHLQPEQRKVLGLNACKYYEENYDRERLLEQLNTSMNEFVVKGKCI